MSIQINIDAYQTADNYRADTSAVQLSMQQKRSQVEVYNLVKLNVGYILLLAYTYFCFFSQNVRHGYIKYLSYTAILSKYILW